MPVYALQISPNAHAAYFSDYLDVAREEFAACIDNRSLAYHAVGSLEFFHVEAEAYELDKFLRLSFVQGVFALDESAMTPLDQNADFLLHSDFVFGSKYKGKTNEHLTQMLINIGLAELDEGLGHQVPGMKLLDPMCGRGTSLFWAMRYGLKAKGIEQDKKAIEDVRRNVKKWCKIHRQKHKLNEGFLGGAKKSKSQRGKSGLFFEFSAEGASARLMTGDAREADTLVKGETFDLIVSDLPYGIQHFASDGSRNPLAVLEACAQSWKACLKKTGVMVLAFNRNNPKRSALVNLFEQAGWQVSDFQAKHRMSESIVRDFLVARHG